MPREIHQFLRSRGWRRHGSWWYRPLPGLRRPWFNQELFGAGRAFELERLRLGPG